MTEAMGGLIWSLDAPLPEQLCAGAGTVLYLSGWCFHRQHPITDLAVTINNQSYPAIAHSITRQDVRELANDFSRNALQSGFWAVVPAIGHAEPATIQIGLRATLLNKTGQTVIHVELGAVNIHITGPTGLRADALTADETSGDLIAICMASHNPPRELFRRQIESIRHQTHSNWVCVISDDASKPEILAEMRAIIGEDSRFRLFPSEKRLGFYHNFERSLLLAPREARYICLSDQDDFWRPEKLRTLLSECDAETQLVYSDMRIVNADGTVHADTYWTMRKNNHTNLSELILANTITGAASLFPRRLLQYLLPFPPRVGNLFHDHWLACVALALGKVKYIDRPLYDYVQHSLNVLGHYTVGGFPASKAIYYLLHHLTSTGGQAHAREVYFQEVLRLKVIATVARLRIGHLIAPANGKILTRFANLDRSPITLLWLALHGLKKWGRMTVTLGTEYQMILGVCWKALSQIKARLGRFRRSG